jgi:DNA-binding LacI/PurR family transcriptional regulator
MRTTIRHVSNRAGVSVGTVSNVLNAPHLVATGTRTKVLEAIAALDYRPSRSARSLQAQRTRLIGYRLPNPGLSPALDVFLHSLVATAANHELELVLFSPSLGQSDLDSYRGLIRSGDVDGFVLSETNYLDPRITLLTESEFPFVAFGRAIAPRPFSWVDVDGAAGMMTVVAHLARNRHERIALIAWPPGSESGDDRYAGFVTGLGRAGMALDSDLVIRIESGFEAGKEAGARLLSRRNRPTAITTVQDEFAFGVMAAAAELGLRVGTDIAVTGFDDSAAAALSTPGLTSVRQPMELVAGTMIERLVDQLHNPGAAATGTLLVPDLMMRASSGLRR